MKGVCGGSEGTWRSGGRVGGVRDHVVNWNRQTKSASVHVPNRPSHPSLRLTVPAGWRRTVDGGRSAGSNWARDRGGWEQREVFRLCLKSEDLISDLFPTVPSDFGDSAWFRFSVLGLGTFAVLAFSAYWAV